MDKYLKAHAYVNPQKGYYQMAGGFKLNAGTIKTPRCCIIIGYFFVRGILM